MQGGDTGKPIVTTDPSSSATRALVKIATRISAAAGALHAV
jgi:hypothetical protein